MHWIHFVTAFGVGSLITMTFQAYLNNRTRIIQRKYNERKEAYIGFWEALERQTRENFRPESFSDVGHWLLRSQFVASENVYILLDTWVTTEPGSNERIKATESLKAAMRDDLRSF